MRIDCVNFLHDIEDKPSVVSQQFDPLQHYCCSHIALDPGAKEPVSRSTQTIVSRFVQEAVSAQFLLANNSAVAENTAQDTSELFSVANVEKIFNSICQQISYFLKRHEWPIHLHILAFIAPPASMQSQKVLLVQVGHPSIMSFDEPKKEVYFLRGRFLQDRDQNHYSTSLGALSGEQAGDIQIEMLDIASLEKERLLVGAPELQFLQSQSLNSIFRDDWDLLDQTLLDILHNQDLSATAPFSCVQLSRGGRLRSLFQSLHRTFSSLRKPASSKVSTP